MPPKISLLPGIGMFGSLRRINSDDSRYCAVTSSSVAAPPAGTVSVTDAPFA